MSPPKPETLHHPTFGELRWDDKGQWWFTQIRDKAGEWLDVVIDPGDGDRLAVVEAAAELYRRAIPEEPRILKQAIKQELLELYNDVWVQDGVQLTASQLAKQLQFSFIKLQPDFCVPIILSYEAGDLFAGHCVDVEVDNQLQVIDVNLIG